MSEDSLQITVCRFLFAALPRQAWFCHVPNEIPQAGNPRAMRVWRQKQLAKGMRPGTPDILLFHRGKAFAIELKWGQGRVSSAQEICHEDLAYAEVPVAVCRSLDDVYNAVTGWGVPLKYKPL